MKKFLKSFRYGQRGFTLIELLVVVAILGILAAVVIPNVMNMMGTGRVQAANTEAHDVEVGVLAAMVKEDVFELTAGGTVGGLLVADGRDEAIKRTDGTSLLVMTAPDDNYITGTLQAKYTFDAYGHITVGTPATDGKWAGLTYTANVGWAEVVVP